MMLFDTLDIENKARQFRTGRLEKINNEVWSPMSDGPYLILHWLPILLKSKEKRS